MEWISVPASEVQPGERVRLASGEEVTATRIDRPFFGESRLAFVEDTPERWYKRPAGIDDTVEVLRST